MKIMTKSYLYPLSFAAAAVMLGACSNDAPYAPGSNEGPGETAYLCISLRDANDITRAGEGSDLNSGDTPGQGEFEYGTGNEGKINSARFFFFDANGNYTGQSTIWNGGTPETSTPAQNIEFKGNSVVVLDNLKGNSYPRYMVTILNGGSAYTNEYMNGKTIEEFSRTPATWGVDSDGGFVMTTTSYFSASGDAADPNHDNARYYATVLDSSNFARSEEDAKGASDGTGGVKPVNVYVERLAARVHLVSKTEFPIDATVMGAEGDNPEIGSDSGIAGTQMFVRIEGWYLNGLQNTSYLSKQFGAWTSAASLAGVDGWAWNAPLFHRSYWGQSVGYGSQSEEALTYYPWNNSTVRTPGQYAYCNENTTDYDNLCVKDNGRPDQRLLTSVVIKATVGTKSGDGTFKGIYIVEHNGVYFTKERFINYVLGIASREGNLNYYTRTGTEGNYTYRQVDASMFDIKGNNDRVQVAKGAGFPAGQLYALVGEKYTETSAASLDNDLAAITSGVRTRAFNEGAMFYNIPVEHLNKKTYDANGDLATWYEGSFGVVRNHAYEITVNSVKRLGQGIFDPDTDVVKPDQDPKDPNWYLGATIRVLSWKIVSSSVDL